MNVIGARAQSIAANVANFVRDVVIPYEKDARCGAHGPTDDLVRELRGKARDHNVLTPHILADGAHLTQRETALVLRASGLSPLSVRSRSTRPLPTKAMCPSRICAYLPNTCSATA